MFLVKPDNFNKTIIIKGFITAILLSLFIYLTHFNINLKIINTLFGLLALYMLLTIPKNSLIIAGFFTGILWFYWVSFSLIYYNFSYLIPICIIGFGLIYAFLFFLLDIIKAPIFRVFSIFMLSYIEPFGFNWFKLELLFVNSYLQTTKLALFFLLVSLYLLTKRSKYKILFIIPLLFCIDYSKSKQIKEPKIKIYMSKIDINQDKKWSQSNKINIIKKNLDEINTAINKGYDLIILPETSFPVLLNKDDFLFNYLKAKSKNIDIITGAMYQNDKGYYNSAYHFFKGNVKIANKVVLVPFGEEIPLPKFLSNFINKLFYNGANDYSKAKETTNFNIKNYKFRNAICYEATTDKIFEKLKNIKYMIAISNNAWFTPSIEPTLQRLLMKYYAKKYNVIIYNVSNGSKNFIIKP